MNVTFLTGIHSAVAGAILLVFAIPGTIIAQDFEAVERRLGGAVEAGEINLAQAVIMMEALLESTDEQERSAGQGDVRERQMDVRTRRFEAAQERLNAAVEAGDISELEAKEWLEQVQLRMRRAADDRSEEELERLKLRYKDSERRILAAVEAGDLSELDADRRLIELRERIFGERERRSREDQAEMVERKRQFEQAVREIKLAVENGDLSEEDAERTLIQLKEQMFEGEEGIQNIEVEIEVDEELPRRIEIEIEQDEEENADSRRERYEMITRRLRRAVEAGDMTPEEARQKLQEIRGEFFPDW